MNLTEMLGFAFGIAGVYLTIREHPACFPIGIINVTISLFLFAGQKLYSDALQQVVYIILLSYGWVQWVGGHRTSTLPVTRTSWRWIVVLAPVTIAMGAGLGLFFDEYTDAQLPYLDAAATAISFTAQFLVAKKKIENWMLWMIVNIGYVGIYIYKELYLYMILFAVYLVLAIVGLRQWRRHLNVPVQQAL